MKIIRQNIETILNENSAYGEIKKSIDETFRIFSDITGIIRDRENKQENYGTILPQGAALHPTLAAGCVFDYARTTKFLRGVKSAIDKLLSEKEKIEILYPGSGPFGSIVIPLLTLYSPNQIEIDIIDLHEVSTTAIKKIIKELNVENFVDDIHQINAVDFQNEKNKSYNLIICECLRYALLAEPQVEMTMALTKFLAPDGIFIPEKINVSAMLCNFNAELSTYSGWFTAFWQKIKRMNAINNRINLGKIFEVNKNINREHKVDKEQQIIECVTVNIPNKTMGNNTLVYHTELKIFEDIILSEEDASGLTKLYIEKSIKEFPPNSSVNYKYQIGSDPKFVAALIEN